MTAVPVWYTYVKKNYKPFTLIVAGIIICLSFIYVKKIYTATDFGKTFGPKATAAENKLQSLQQNFELCARLCHSDARFMQSIVFPEVMRFSSIKDGVEAESLRTLYVQFGKGYANFSIGQFQMKPTFAEEVEIKSTQLLPDSIAKELQLAYTVTDAEAIRLQRVERLQDTDWQMVYLTAFVAICNSIYAGKKFASPTEQLQWYATVYNAGFNKTDDFISKKIVQDNFYLNQQMPGKKFKYAAIAGWFYTKAPH
jgi:hypothetical protein